MLMITELLTPTPGPLWRLVKQAGIDHVVTRRDGGRQRWGGRDPGQEEGPPPCEAPPRGERAWDRPALARLQAAYREYGLELAVIEDTAPMDAARLGTAGRDEQISWLHDQIRAMGELGIGTLCYNWHAVTGWARTHHDVPLRGGARSGGYDDATMRRAAPVAEPGSIRTDPRVAAPEHGLAGRTPPDHAPAVAGESTESYGSAPLGRLFAVGYIPGLRDATYGRPPAGYGRHVDEDALR